MNDLKVLRKLFKYVPQKRRFHLLIMAVSMIASGIAELFTLAAVIPFITVITQPERILESKTFINLFSYLNFSKGDDLIFPITLLFITLAILSSIIKVINLWLYTNFSAYIGNDISVIAYRNILNQPYKFHIESNSSRILNDLTLNTGATANTLKSWFKMLSSILIIISIGIGLAIVNPLLTACIILGFSFVYLLVAIIVKKRLLVSGQRYTSLGRNQIKIIQEGNGNIRDIIIGGNQNSFIKLFKDANKYWHKSKADIAFLTMLPRLSIEGISTIILAIVSLVLISIYNDNLKVITMLGALVLGAQKILPCLQSIYGSWSKIRSDRAAVINVLNLLDLDNKTNLIDDNYRQNIFSDKIELRNLSFRYKKDLALTLSKINFCIEKGDSIVIIGETGSGKSTLLDIILGLRKPS